MLRALQNTMECIQKVWFGSSEAPGRSVLAARKCVVNSNRVNFLFNSEVSVLRGPRVIRCTRTATCDNKQSVLATVRSVARCLCFQKLSLEKSER